MDYSVSNFKRRIYAYLLKKTMLRFTTTRNLCAIFKTSAVSRVSKCKGNLISLPLCGIGIHKVNFFTKSHYRKDVSLPNPQEVSEHGQDTIDLDKWKAVMKLKAVPEENIRVDDASDSDEDTKPGDLTLEATRELVTMWRMAGKRVPEEINEEELQTLAGLDSKTSRRKYLKSLAIRENHKKSRKIKKEVRKAEKEQIAKLKEDDEDKGLKESLILQYWNRSLDKLLAWRSAQAMIFGQSLVFDMSYEDNMTKREIENTVSQLLDVDGLNRRATEPFHLHFCNLQPDSYSKQQLIKRYGEAWDRLFITSTDKQHYEVFPREQLVYLTADSPNVLRKYDHDKVYIIGGMVDRSIRSGISLANAKRLRLATARLPLDEYLHWEQGSKNLTLDCVMNVLLTIKETGKWEEALKFVPTRKHSGLLSHKPKMRQTVMNKPENPLQRFSKDFTLSDAKIRSTFNRPRTVNTKKEKSKQETRNKK